MKSILIFSVMGFITSSSFAATFTAKGSETLYYYQLSTSGAAEAKMWKSALAICSKSDTRESILPIRISETAIITDEQSAIITASAQFKCVDAEGREY